MKIRKKKKLKNAKNKKYLWPITTMSGVLMTLTAYSILPSAISSTIFPATLTTNNWPKLLLKMYSGATKKMKINTRKKKKKKKNNLLNHFIFFNFFLFELRKKIII